MNAKGREEKRRKEKSPGVTLPVWEQEGMARHVTVAVGHPVLPPSVPNYEVFSIIIRVIAFFNRF